MKRKAPEKPSEINPSNKPILSRNYHGKLNSINPWEDQSHLDLVPRTLDVHRLRFLPSAPPLHMIAEL